MELKLYDRVRIKQSGLTGEIIDEGVSGNGLPYFILELDDQEQEHFLPTVSPEDVEKIDN